jgi:hypothetical protein
VPPTTLQPRGYVFHVAGKTWTTGLLGPRPRQRQPDGVEPGEDLVARTRGDDLNCFLQASLPDPTFARRPDCLYHVHNKTGAASPIGAAAEARAAQHTGLIWLPVKSAGTEGALDKGGDLERRGGIAAAFNSHGFGGNTTGRTTPGGAIISRTKAPSNTLAPSRRSARRAGIATNHVASSQRRAVVDGPGDDDTKRCEVSTASAKKPLAPAPEAKVADPARVPTRSSFSLFENSRFHVAISVPRNSHFLILDI